MTTTIANRIAAATAMAFGSAAIALGAAAVTAPTASASSFQQTCINNPGSYATGATRGVYTTERRGSDRYEICKVYNAQGVLLGTAHLPNYNWYSKVTPPVVPPLSVLK